MYITVQYKELTDTRAQCTLAIFQKNRQTLDSLWVEDMVRSLATEGKEDPWVCNWEAGGSRQEQDPVSWGLL